MTENDPAEYAADSAALEPESRTIRLTLSRSELTALCHVSGRENHEMDDRLFRAWDAGRESVAPRKELPKGWTVKDTHIDGGMRAGDRVSRTFYDPQGKARDDISVFNIFEMAERESQWRTIRLTLSRSELTALCHVSGRENPAMEDRLFRAWDAGFEIS